MLLTSPTIDEELLGDVLECPMSSIGKSPSVSNVKSDLGQGAKFKSATPKQETNLFLKRLREIKNNFYDTAIHFFQGQAPTKIAIWPRTPKL